MNTTRLLTGVASGLVYANLTMAASCPSLVGDWEVNCDGAYYEPSDGTSGCESSTAISHITS